LDKKEIQTIAEIDAGLKTTQDLTLELLEHNLKMRSKLEARKQQFFRELVIKHNLDNPVKMAVDYKNGKLIVKEDQDAD